jgi:hypothetical protein
MMDPDWDDSASADFEMFKLSYRDRALSLLGNIDLDSQLIAIRSLLRRKREAEAQVSNEIKQLASQIQAYAGGDQLYQMHMENHWVDKLHGAVFQDAAHSMSAIGILAPFMESLFVSIFRGLQNQSQIAGAADPRGKATDDLYWNPKIVFDKGAQRMDIVAGIKQLSTSTGLHYFMPDGYLKTLSAVFAYRNNMFHNGFEWPPEAREKFSDRIKNESWPDIWFSQAMHGGQPWVFYMSDDFIETNLKLIDQVLEGAGKYIVKNNLTAKPPSNEGES